MHVEDRHGLDELRRLARREREAGLRVRMQAIVLAVQSRPSTEIARTLDVGTRSVQEWVRRYNQGGVEALRRRSGQGRPCWLSKEQRARLCDRIDAGAREQDQVCTLRGADIQRLIQGEFGKLYRLNGIYDLLHRLGYSCLMPRPKHRKSDPQAQSAFKKTSSSRWRPFVRPIPTSESKSGSKMKRASGNKER
jgi:transposase